ncbi:Ig-like domain-containing protein [Pontibacter liquoris]|uniref:Ig-like domain-containing protein n=1 Tax=Pontibacter liquoris TaxID=2905677 RepID=UPI001FA77ECC|nr:Ig-like domain-containing protein [Pontibacter liquoris]
MKIIATVLMWMSVTLIFSSCVREDVDVFTIEGYITDEISHQPIAGVPITFIAIKSPSGMGILNGGNSETAGQATTNEKGYYKAKLKVIKEANGLEMQINEDHLREGYMYITHPIPISDLRKGSNSTFSHTLSPTAILKIKFVNISPVSDLDEFQLLWSTPGWAKGIIDKQSCGTVKESEVNKWIGKDVCGVYTIDVVAGYKKDIDWMVTKNNIERRFSDSVYVKLGEINEFQINY